jgi:endoglycosylceramidase
MNEPFGGDVWSDPLLWVPPIADRVSLQPLYDELAASIRAVDTQHFVFFESVVRCH